MELYKNDNWEVIFVDWCQEFPGQCIISCQKESLSELTSEDWVSFGLIEKELERVCKKLFGATMFNVACLMNNAYRDKTKPNVHFQFIPRYQESFELLGRKYTDKHFGYNMWKWSLNSLKCQKDIFSKDEKNIIYAMMKKEFKL